MESTSVLLCSWSSPCTALFPCPGYFHLEISSVCAVMQLVSANYFRLGRDLWHVCARAGSCACADMSKVSSRSQILGKKQHVCKNMDPYACRNMILIYCVWDLAGQVHNNMLVQDLAVCIYYSLKHCLLGCVTWTSQEVAGRITTSSLLRCGKEGYLLL